MKNRTIWIIIAIAAGALAWYNYKRLQEVTSANTAINQAEEKERQINLNDVVSNISNTSTGVFVPASGGSGREVSLSDIQANRWNDNSYLADGDYGSAVVLTQIFLNNIEKQGVAIDGVFHKDRIVTIANIKDIMRMPEVMQSAAAMATGLGYNL